MAREIFESVLRTVGLPSVDPAEVEIIGRDPIYATRFRIGEAFPISGSFGLEGVSAPESTSAARPPRS